MAIQEAVVPPPTLSIVEDNTEQRGGLDSSRSPVPGRSKGDYILGASSAMCTALEKVGSIAPVPFLKEAAGVAGNLLQMIIDKSLNEGAFRSLLHEICDLIMVLQSECDAAKTITDEFKASVEEVLEQLTALEKLCLEYDDKNMLDKLLFHNLHKEDIEERRRRVEQIFRRFNLVNSITIRRRVDELVEAYNKRSVDLMPNADAENLLVQSSPPGRPTKLP
ncbi:hypothetical protein NLJ89_g4477 [Agrocybe chaxingu]|uniref:Uncharacterized protein n=1 Tax=Agrocybe chaxingu TaxID=84603 RepID=A0A9W8K2L7_9AGAR|nr:hypothetical protein NLJ89_g4477 [Agrocybe chaxingu]